MGIRIEVCPDQHLSAAADAYLTRRRGPGWRLLALCPAVVGVALLFGGRRAWVYGGLLIAVGLLEAVLLPWLRPRLAARRDPPPASVLELRDEGVRAVSRGYDVDRPWSTFEQTVELPGQFLLIVNKRHYVSVPTGGLSTAQLDDLRTLLADRAPALAASAPGNRVGERGDGRGEIT
jgi:YcxB-like protein